MTTFPVFFKHILALLCAICYLFPAFEAHAVAPTKAWGQPPRTYNSPEQECLDRYGATGWIVWRGVLSDGKNSANCQLGHHTGVVFSMVESWFCPKDFPKQEGNDCIADNDPDKSKGCGDCSEGNPINVLTGNKYQITSDYRGIGPFPLTFTRTYNSFGHRSGDVTKRLVGTEKMGLGGEFRPAPPFSYTSTVLTSDIVGMETHAPIGEGWRHSYDRSVVTVATALLTVAKVFRPDSKVVSYTLGADGWLPTTRDITARLVELKTAEGVRTGWEYTTELDEVETYGETGRLLSIKNRLGLVQTLQYDAQNRLASVTDPVGRQLKFTYNAAGAVESMEDPAASSYQYHYDALGNLVRVINPELSFVDYRYEDARFPHALTGLIDENQSRFGTWKYSETGRAISSEHGDGLEKVTLTGAGNALWATDADGSTRTYYVGYLNRMAVAGDIYRNCGAGCDGYREVRYDGNNNVVHERDYHGVKTTYAFDLSRNLQTRRIDADGTSRARITTTVWHPSFRLPIKISQPGKLTQFSYFANGTLQSRSEQATADANGSQGVNAAVLGQPRVWTYTYNALGQILTVTGPRSQVLERTTYTYDALGNLTSVTNSAQHTTSFSDYDAHGRVGRVTDANGSVTDYTYNHRGAVLSRATRAGSASLQTRFEYDGVGQMKKVTLPDGSTTSFSYDAGHRLTDVNDGVGNSIRYTLDLKGNRIKEEIRDGNGTLNRQIDRIFDQLSRLKQVTGAQQ